MLTLWDLFKPIAQALRSAPAKPPTQPKPRPLAPARRPPKRQPARVSAKARYDSITREMLHLYGVRVKRWRKSMSGIAWQVQYHDGTIARLIESPQPKGPMSAAIFLHEIGHHAIGLGIYKPRCLEEYHAWKFSLDHMEKLGLDVTDAVKTRMDKSLRYAVAKARRRGIKTLPAELTPYDR